MSIRVQDYCLTLAKGHSDFKSKLIFSENIGSFENEVWKDGNENLYK